MLTEKSLLPEFPSPEHSSHTEKKHTSEKKKFVGMMFLGAFVFGGVSGAVFGMIMSLWLPQTRLYGEYVKPVTQQQADTPASLAAEETSAISVVLAATKSVVAIGGGTGFLISEDGLILTNKHVVSDDKEDYKVLLHDGREFDAHVLGRDPLNDLAVLKIDAQGLPFLALGDSDTLQVGQTVIAIGNSLGTFDNTVTKGIVSGIRGRVETGDIFGPTETIESAIQTDAAINAGNSGGPLLNLKGEVVGINTAVSTAGQSIGFATPVNQAKIIVESLLVHGKLIRPYLGVRYILVDDALASLNGMTITYGALVVRGELASELAVAPQSPAALAGIEENDIILEVNG